MILFNLLLSFAAVWSFQRMTPEIKRIYERNVVSLDACEKMLLVLAEDKIDYPAFQAALHTAGSNITENGEKESIARIHTLLLQLQKNDPTAKQKLTGEIIKLTNFNKQAIIASALQTQKLRQASVWGIVFMTLIFFGLALFFEQRIRRRLLTPLQEINSVLTDHLQGDKFRRCSMIYASGDMHKLFAAINDLLDRK